MPLFDWTASDPRRSRFWVYWAVTGPLTLVTMLLVVLMVVWNDKKAPEKMAEVSLRPENEKAEMLSNSSQTPTDAIARHAGLRIPPANGLGFLRACFAHRGPTRRAQGDLPTP
jgi:hypothetical protein